jgi:hypothetical protein
MNEAELRRFQYFLDAFHQTMEENKIVLEDGQLMMPLATSYLACIIDEFRKVFPSTPVHHDTVMIDQSIPIKNGKVNIVSTIKELDSYIRIFYD